MAATTRSLVAYVHVADVGRSIAFYADLGFTVADSAVADDRSVPVWAWLQSGAASLMVGQASRPVDASQQAILFYLYVDDIAQARAALVARGHAVGEIRYPFHLPDGEFRLEDPDGYVLMLAQAEGR